MATFRARVMTCNVRFPSPGDAGNLWEERRGLLARMIAESAPDVVGLQEAYRVQLAYLAESLPGYACVGRERYGASDEEHAAILVRCDRFMVEACGTYWLSDAPDEPGSRTWKPDDHPRIVTWARLVHLPTASRLGCLDTHFHLGDDAVRGRSAALIWGRHAAHAEFPTVLMGDFNARPDSLAHLLLTGREPMPDGARADFRDAWEIADVRVGSAATFHRFTGQPVRDDARIDWVLVRGPVRVTRAETVAFNEDGRYPSDHFPVIADLTIGEA